MAHDGVFLVEWEALSVGAAGAGGAEAIVDELGDKVVIRRSAPEGVYENGAKSWMISCGRWSVW